MGIAPCSICARRFTGAATHVYPAVADGSQADRFHHRLCPGCSSDYRSLLQEHCIAATADGYLQDDITLHCLSCGAEPGSERLPVFATAYWAPDERRDYFGVVCRVCRPLAEALLGFR